MATYAFSGGVAGINPWGTRSKTAFSGSWLAQDTWFLQGVSAEQGNFTLGLGNISNTSPSCGMVFGNRVYMGINNRFVFSDINDPTAWEEQATGAGSVLFLSQYGYQDTVNAFEVFQGFLSVFGRFTIEIWTVNADPSQFALKQVLTNVGTQAPESVKALGELDVFFLDDTGVRSLRVRDSSLNAFAVDIGSPVDIPIQAAIQGGALAASACAVVEPATKRYWIYLGGTIYVLSYYPSLKITAWSTYLPTIDNGTTGWKVTNQNNAGDFNLDVYVSNLNDISTATHFIVGQGTFTNVPLMKYYWIYETVIGGPSTLSFSGLFPQNAFVNLVVSPDGSTLTTFTNISSVNPVKFIVFQGQVYFRADNNEIYVYGGVNNNTYDHVVATIESPWLDAKRPQNQKLGSRLNVAMSGTWQLEVGLDPQGTTPTQIVVPYQNPVPVGSNAATDSTFGKGVFSEDIVGTHFKFKAYTNPLSANPAVLASTTEQYEPGAEQ